MEHDLADSYCRRRKHLLSHLRKVHAGERERLCLARHHLSVVGAACSSVGMFYLTGARGLCRRAGQNELDGVGSRHSRCGIGVRKYLSLPRRLEGQCRFSDRKHHACLRTACRGSAALSRDHHAASGPRRSRLPCGHLSRGRVTRDARNYIRKGRREPSFFHAYLDTVSQSSSTRPGLCLVRKPTLHSPPKAMSLRPLKSSSSFEPVQNIRSLGSQGHSAMSRRCS